MRPTHCDACHAPLDPDEFDCPHSGQPIDTPISTSAILTPRSMPEHPTHQGSG